MARTADIINVRVQSGWLRFLIGVANLLARMRLRSVAALWVYLMQPFFIVRMQVAGRWTFNRLPMRIYLQGRGAQAKKQREEGE